MVGNGRARQETSANCDTNCRRLQDKKRIIPLPAQPLVWIVLSKMHLPLRTAGSGPTPSTPRSVRQSAGRPGPRGLFTHTEGGPGPSPLGTGEGSLPRQYHPIQIRGEGSKGHLVPVQNYPLAICSLFRRKADNSIMTAVPSQKMQIPSVRSAPVRAPLVCSVGDPPVCYVRDVTGPYPGRPPTPPP